MNKKLREKVIRLMGIALFLSESKIFANTSYNAEVNTLRVSVKKNIEEYYIDPVTVDLDRPDAVDKLDLIIIKLGDISDSIQHD